MRFDRSGSNLFGAHTPDLVRKATILCIGLWQILRHDPVQTLQILISFIILGVCFWMQDWLDFVVFLAVTGFMLSLEGFNTALESLCDYIQPGYDPRIGAIKDMSAAAVGILVLVWIIILVFELGRIWMILTA